MASRGTSCDRRKASLFLRAARKRAIPPPSPLSHKSSYVFTVHTIVAASASFTARSKLSSASDRTSRHGLSLWPRKNRNTRASAKAPRNQLAELEGRARERAPAGLAIEGISRFQRVCGGRRTVIVASSASPLALFRHTCGADVDVDDSEGVAVMTVPAHCCGTLFRKESISTLCVHVAVPILFPIFLIARQRIYVANRVCPDCTAPCAHSPSFPASRMKCLARPSPAVAPRVPSPRQRRPPNPLLQARRKRSRTAEPLRRSSFTC